MKIRHRSTAPVSGASAHRPGGISFVHLMEGDEGAPDNFGFTLVDAQDEFFTPRHRHNFEQVRIMLEGSFEFGPGLRQDAGTIGYFCEGTYYTQKGIGRSVTLLLQVAGASGEGYMNHAQLRANVAALEQEGTFDNGVYSWIDAAGRKHNKDGYEAAWERANNRPLVYPKPRYQGPVLMTPANFAYLPLAPGVEQRRLGRFNERGLDLRQLRLGQGAVHRIDGGDQPWLLYALSGAGSVEGQSWSAGSALMVERGEQIEIGATETGEFYLIGLPTFDDRQPQAARIAA